VMLMYLPSFMRALVTLVASIDNEIKCAIL
jgi:hypothetical protein